MVSIPAIGRRAATLVGGCVVVGIGVGLVLLSRLGSDGYSTALYGIAVRARVPYAITNWAVALLAVTVAAMRRVRPGVATVVHPLVVGTTVDVVLHLGSVGVGWGRLLTLLAGTLAIAVGVAVYLVAGLGSGPFESLALALRPVPFRYAYVTLQAAGTLTGLALGAPVGPGTVLIVFGVGPLAAALRGRIIRRRE